MCYKVTQILWPVQSASDFSEPDPTPLKPRDALLENRPPPYHYSPDVTASLQADRTMADIPASTEAALNAMVRARTGDSTARAHSLETLPGHAGFGLQQFFYLFVQLSSTFSSFTYCYVSNDGIVIAVFFNSLKSIWLKLPSCTIVCKFKFVEQIIRASLPSFGYF